MRYLKPDASKTGERMDALAKAGDQMVFPTASIVVGMTSLIMGSAFAVESLMFLLLFLPLLIIAGLWGSYYYNTVPLASSYGEDRMYANSLKEYKKTIGDHTEELAKPIMDKVLEHAKGRHPGGGTKYHYLDWYTDCKICSPRLAVLKELAPKAKSIESKDDIEQAKLFLQARKEITGA